MNLEEEEYCELLIKVSTYFGSVFWFFYWIESFEVIFACIFFHSSKWHGLSMEYSVDHMHVSTCV